MEKICIGCLYYKHCPNFDYFGFCDKHNKEVKTLDSCNQYTTQK